MIVGGHWICKFGAIFEKYSLKIFTNSLSSNTTFPFSIIVIFPSFKVLSVRHGFTVFQNLLFSVKRLKSRLLKNSFLVFRSSLTQTFRCFLCATCDHTVLSCLNLFNNLELVMIAFLNFLFTNAAWLHLICFSFNGACLSKIYWAVTLNESRCLAWTFSDSNWFRRSFLNRLLSIFFVISMFDYLWFLFLKVSFQNSKI